MNLKRIALLLISIGTMLPLSAGGLSSEDL